MQQAPPLPRLSLARPLLLRVAQAGEVSYVWQLQERGGALNGYWKGGQTRHKAGYIMRRAPTHPRATTSGGYVFEHILVMRRPWVGTSYLASRYTTATVF